MDKFVSVPFVATGAQGKNVSEKVSVISSGMFLFPKEVSKQEASQCSLQWQEEQGGEEWEYIGRGEGN